MKRIGEIERTTKETSVSLSIDLDGAGISKSTPASRFSITCWERSPSTACST